MTMKNFIKKLMYDVSVGLIVAAIIFSLGE